jgi:hypothetical protein
MNNQLQKETKLITNRCSICTSGKVSEINAAINDEKSLHAISRQFFGSDRKHDSIRRHLQRCLNLEIKFLVKENRIKAAEDFHRLRIKTMQQTEKMLDACDEWMTDPDNAFEYTLAPRANDLEVVYEDPTKLDQKGKPVRRKKKLVALLEEVQKISGKKAVKIINRQMDNRKLFFETMKIMDKELDLLARLEGRYYKDRQEQEDLVKTVLGVIENRAARRGVPREEEIKLYLSLFAHEITPVIREALEKELE